MIISDSSGAHRGDGAGGWDVLTEFWWSSHSSSTSGRGFVSKRTLRTPFWIRAQSAVAQSSAGGGGLFRPNPDQGEEKSDCCGGRFGMGAQGSAQRDGKSREDAPASAELSAEVPALQEVRRERDAPAGARTHCCCSSTCLQTHPSLPKSRPVPVCGAARTGAFSAE